jgi:hypothetical protein
MNRRQLCSTIGCFFAFVVLCNAANAQSKRIDNPTPLTSNEISGVIDDKTKDDAYYYYSFSANPGEVKVTVTVERNLNIDNAMTLMSVDFILYDSNSEVLIKKTAATYGSENQPAVTKAYVSITKRQTLILGIRLPGGRYFGGVGKYKVRIDGADTNKPNNKSTGCDDFAAALSGENLFRFPEKGTLFIIFVKGGMKINLSSVKSISICDPTNQLKTKELKYGEINLPKEGNISIDMKDGGGMSVDLSQISSIAILS